MLGKADPCGPGICTGAGVGHGLEQQSESPFDIPWTFIPNPLIVKPVMPREKYGIRWPDEVDDLQIEMGCIQRGGTWVKNGNYCGKGLSFHYEQMRMMLWPELDGDHNGQRWHTLCKEQQLSHKITVLMGPGSCVSGDTKLQNPITGKHEPIKSLSDSGTRPTVMTLDGPKLAGIPFIKGMETLIEVVLKSGRRFRSTSGHLVLTELGFQAVGSLRIGQSLISFAQPHQKSIWEPSQQVSFLDARRLWKKVPNSQSDYQSYSHSCDEPPQKVSESSQYAPPSQSDVQKYTRYASGIAYDSGRKPKRIHPYREAFPLSNSDALDRGSRLIEHILRGSFSAMLGGGGDSFGSPSMFSPKTRHGQSSRSPKRDSFHNFPESEKPCWNYRVQVDEVQQLKSCKKEIYYDLQVPDKNHYFAEGAIHHNSGKTHESAWLRLCEYYCFPNETCVMVSSTDMRGLELRVWGEIKSLHERAKQVSDVIPGFLIDSKHCISTDNIEEDEKRDLRKGIIGIPCVQNGKFVGLGKYAGIKQKRVRLIADEAQFMGAAFLSAFANLDKNEDFQATVLGNPSDLMDPLGKAAEPKDGWGSHMEPEKTSVWDTRFMNGVCVNLVGTDSPNNDFPGPARFKYLISKEKIANTASFFSKDSLEYMSQCVGVMKIGVLSKRIITRELCNQFKALEPVIWRGSPLVSIAGLDSAYGGDRCVLVHAEFGADVEGKTIVNVVGYQVVPIPHGEGTVVEDKISEFCKNYCISKGIPPENFFHDSTGRGSLGTSLGRVWSTACNPVEFGGQPTLRPVTHDHFINDPQTGTRRLKTCREHYSKFVTELWYSVRYCIEAGQLRNLPEEIMDEGCMREFKTVAGDKKELEPKWKMKERAGRSPDLFDGLSIAVEGARRRGFQISKLANKESQSTNTAWLKAMLEKKKLIRSGHTLVTA